MVPVLDVARSYTAAGWRVVPIEYRTKRPPDHLKQWQELRIGDADLGRYFHAGPQNVGVLLGDPSGGLVDIDLDTPEAIVLAPMLLPATPGTFGRSSKPRSHYLFRAPGLATERFLESYTDPADGKRKRTTLLELRSSGGQTVFPGSVHESGELVEWSDDVPDGAELADLAPVVQPAHLRRRVAQLAAAVMLMRSGMSAARAAVVAQSAPEDVPGRAGEMLRQWLHVELRPAPAPEPATQPARSSVDLEEAVRLWNDDHRREWPRNSAPCPVCGDKGSFGRLPKSPERWSCHSTDHPDDVGLAGKDCFHGDALDIEAHARGKSRVAVLRDDGYLVSRTSTDEYPGQREHQPTGQQGQPHFDAEGPKQAQKPPPVPSASEAVLVLWGSPLPPALPTGIVPLDRAITGLRAESISVLNGPPGRGKSGFVIQIARHVAGTGRDVVYLTSELSARQVYARAIAQILGEPWLRTYELGPSEAERLARAVVPLSLRVIEIGRGADLRSILDRVADQLGRAPVLILDYLQHAARRIGMDDQRLAVGHIADVLVTWARDAKSTGMCVSSVGRVSYKTDDASAEDLLAAGKDAGEIEYDASLVLYLAAKLAPLGESAPVKLHVSKHRFGPSGMTLGLSFNAAIGSFEDDPTAAISELDRACFCAVQKGARTQEEVRKAVEAGKPRVVAALAALCRLELIDGPPYRVLRDLP